MDVDAVIEGYADDMVGLLARLVSIESVNPPGSGYLAMLDSLEEECRSLGMVCTRYPVAQKRMRELALDAAHPRVNMIARLERGMEKTIHFNGHIDVVPATNDWKDAFKLRREGDRLYGRGASDMKSGFVCYLYALKSLIESGDELMHNVEMSFVCDEETGGHGGMRELAEVINADVAIGEGVKGECISIGNKGILWFKVTIKGKAAHSAYSFRGVNSFEKMHGLLGELLLLKQVVEKRRSTYPTEAPEEGYASMTIGGEIHGGEKTNTVPQMTSFSIDRRVLPDEKMDDAKQEILDCITAFSRFHPDVDITVEVTNEDGPVIVDPDSEFCKKMLSAVTEVLGKESRAMMTSGGTDMRYLIMKGIPSLGYSAYGENLHGDSEWVSLSSMVQTAKVFARLIQR